MAKGRLSVGIEAIAVLLGALAANLGIAIAKFIAAGISGSSSMLTEGVHSLVDSCNQLLLLYGQRRSKKPADRTCPFGYAFELYFWAFIVAMLIFAAGSGVSIYEGLSHHRNPEPLRDPTINYAVLVVAFDPGALSNGLAASSEGGARAASIRPGPVGGIVETDGLHTRENLFA